MTLSKTTKQTGTRGTLRKSLKMSAAILNAIFTILFEEPFVYTLKLWEIACQCVTFKYLLLLCLESPDDRVL